MTEHLIPLVGSYNLPRKYKIAFSGCAADCALAQVADLGFIAEIRDGKPGFRVLAGGGMGAHSRVADTLLEWAPATEILRVAETVRRLFDQFGDRANKHRARLRFVFDRIGAGEFRRRYMERMEEVTRDGTPPWSGPAAIVGAAGRAASTPATESLEGVRVIRQRQEGYVAVPLHLPLGFVSAADFARIGEFAARFSGEAGLRATRSQNLLIRHVPYSALPDLAAGLRALETDVLTPAPLNRFVACAGASTCRMGICLARNAARACADALAGSDLRRSTLEAMEFHLNGCTNACGQQPVGAVGFYGMALRSGTRLLPAYGITVGGRCGPDGARFGAAIGRVPARALPAFVRDLASDFERRRSAFESFVQYADRLGVDHFKALAARHAAVPAPSDRPEFYRDLGAEEEFSLAGRGAGECGSGVFEVIQQDLAAARKAMRPFDVLMPATRALLVTRGVDARDPDTVLREFERHFIDTGLVGAEFRGLLARARGYAQGWTVALDGQEADIERLLERVERLYATLDANLQFHPPAAEAPKIAAPAAGAAPPALAADGGATVELDLSGVPCPLNFVKAKIKLELMRAGDTLGLVLDDGEPIRNVPGSLRSEGQEIVFTQPHGAGRWRVVVRKRE